MIQLLRGTSANRLGKLAIAAMLPFLWGSTGLTTNFKDRALSAQNRERQLVGVPPLEWDDRLQAAAQSWADQLAATGRFEHAPVGMEGENLWSGTRGYYSVDAMIDAWVREKRFYKTAVFPNNSSTGRIEDVGHYTQLIWRRTSRVGCALASGSNDDVLVCRYSESGNWVGSSPI
jgi:hypothetical protein